MRKAVVQETDAASGGQGGHRNGNSDGGGAEGATAKVCR